MANYVIQWNCRSNNNKKQILSICVTNSDTALAISETWSHPCSVFRLTCYTYLRDDRAEGFASCALLIKRSSSFSQIPVPSHCQNINNVAARCYNVTYVSIYIPHPSENLIFELSSILSSLLKPLIVLGDIYVTLCRAYLFVITFLCVEWRIAHS